jgi:hypothetical protein
VIIIPFRRGLPSPIAELYTRFAFFFPCRPRNSKAVTTLVQASRGINAHHLFPAAVSPLHDHDWDGLPQEPTERRCVQNIS